VWSRILLKSRNRCLTYENPGLFFFRPSVHLIFQSLLWHYGNKSFGMDVDCHNKFTTASSVRQDKSFQIRILSHCPSQQPPNTSPYLQATIEWFDASHTTDRVWNGKPNYSVEIPTRCSFVIEFIIPKFNGSTCFERHTAHHQELRTVFAASGLFAHMVTGRCQGWVPTQLIIRSSELYLQPLVYMPIRWPAVAKVECPLSLGNGRSPYGHINQRLQIQFGAPDDEWCAARNMLNL